MSNQSSLYDKIPLVSITKLEPIILESGNKIKSFDDASTKLKRDFDKLEYQISSLTEYLINLETNASDCKQLAELSQVLSDSSYQQLDQIHQLHGSNSFVKSILLFFRSFLPNKK